MYMSIVFCVVCGHDVTDEIGRLGTHPRHTTETHTQKHIRILTQLTHTKTHTHTPTNSTAVATASATQQK